MKWYPRQLKGTDELKAERQKLLALREETSRADFFLADLPGTGSQGGSRGSQGLFDLATNFLSSKTVLGGVIAVAMPLVRFLPARLQKKFLFTFAREFFGGYARGKALSTGFRFVRSLLRKK
jgi:hypothetical protein